MKRIVAIMLSLVLLGNMAEARKVTGKVVCGKEKLSGVIVTDGKSFTKTVKGKFAFDIADDAEFVYIVTPAGYAADWSTGVPAFYQSAKDCKKFTFELLKTGTAENYNIIAIADPQTRSKKHFRKFAGKPMEDLCITATDLGNSAVGIVLGDICWDALDQLELYKKEIVRTGIPFYPVVGNHDHEKESKGDNETTAVYRSTMGPENYAFFLGKDIVIAVDDIIYDTQKKYKDGYTLELIDWISGLMKMVPSESVVYVAQHSPVLHWDKGGYTNINTDKLYSALEGHEIIFLSGHTHITNNFRYADNITEHNIAAICGSWWDTLHCTDGTPRGYKVFTKTGDQLTWYYKSVDYPKDHQVEIYGIGQTTNHPESIVANVWDWDPEWKIEWYQDGVYMGPMENVHELCPVYQKEIAKVFTAKGEEIPRFKKPRLNYHYFAATPSEGAKKVKIVVQSRFGQEWEYEIAIF